jgi:hypothetical protein
MGQRFQSVFLMASRRKILWRVPRVGQLRALKKDPTKKLFYVEAWHSNPKKANPGPYFFSIRDSQVPTWWLEKTTRWVAEYVAQEEFSILYREHAEQALDFLFEELSRRAPKPVVG